MKKIFAKTYIIFLFILFFSFQLKAQNQITIFLEGKAADTEKLMEGYLDPLMKGFGLGISNGWYNTGKPHKLFGFDITATVSAIFIPDADKFYTLPEGLESVVITGNNDQLPTIFGSSDINKRPKLRFTDDAGNKFSRITTPGLDIEKKIGVNVVSVPMIQVGIGIFKKTDLKFRYVSRSNYFGDSDFQLLGIGIMHSIKQWIPAIKEAPFDLSLFVGYTTMKNRYKLPNFADQNAGSVIEVNSINVQGVLSKKLGFFTLYGGAGYASTTLNTKLNGSFKVERTTNNINVVKDPIDLKSTIESMKLNAGFRLKFAILTLYTEYSLQESSALTVGIGISVR